MAHRIGHAMPDTPTLLARIAVREAHCRRSGDTYGADQARADWDALADRVPPNEWADVYRQTLADNRRG